MANLVLEEGSHLIFLGSRQWTNPNKGNTLTFAAFGDSQSFENHEFIVNPAEINLNIPLHTPVKVTFGLDKFNGRTSLQLKSILQEKVPVKA